MKKEKIKVLLIEDDQDDALLIELILKESDITFELKRVDRLSSGIEQVKSNGFDAILLDLGLPDSQGLAALIKLNEVKPKAPIIVLTGLEDKTIGIQAVKEGAQDYLVKGQIDRNQLTRSIYYSIERRQIEDALRQKTALLEAQLNSSIEGILVVDGQGKKVLQNKRTIDLWKIPEHIADNIDDQMQVNHVMHMTKNPEQFIEKVAYLYSHPDETSHDEVELTDGTVLDRYSAPVLGKDGKNYGRIWAFRDITERKIAENALRDAENRYRLLFDQSPDGIVLMDPETGRFLEFNDTACRQLGYSREEFARLSMVDFEPRETPDDTKKRIAKPSLEARSDFETLYRTRQGEIRNIHVTAQVIQIAGRMVYHYVWRDITEHRKLEMQYLHAQKMESIGTLAGGIAHDFNNILSAIIGYGHVALMKMAEDDPQRLTIKNMLEAADRATHLTKDLLLFSRKQAGERKPVEINGVVRKIEQFLRRVISEDIECKTILSDKSLPVLADSHQLEQVLMNLATNARDAMPKGGSFIVQTEEITLKEDFTAAHGYGKPGIYARITVSDTGMGMNKSTRKRIFEPFFTTKEVGKGTGLGMSVVYGIIKDHDGFINVYTEPGQGTTFRIYLPFITPAAQEETPMLQEEAPARGTETVLLAEDDESLMKLSRIVLAEHGYTVIEAIDGEDAVKKFIENKESIQLLLIDLIMPKMNGKEACDAIRKIKPDIKVIFTSGYAPDMVQRKVSLGNGSGLICKPVSPMALLRMVRSVLDGEWNKQGEGRT